MAEDGDSHKEFLGMYRAHERKPLPNHFQKKTYLIVNPIFQPSDVLENILAIPSAEIFSLASPPYLLQQQLLLFLNSSNSKN